MIAANFRDDVLYPACDDLGIDPEQDLNKDQAGPLARSINLWTREGWQAWPWPELNLTEERAFRQVWFAEAAYLRSNPVFGRKPDELYYIPTASYYRVKATAPADPPVGTSPTDATYFEALPEPWDRYVAYDQPGKQSIDLVRGISNVDPRTSASGIRYPFAPGENGISVFGWSGTGSATTVWLRYQVRPSRFSAELYDADKQYRREDVVFHKASGNCYLALAPAKGTDPQNSALWLLQPMPDFLAAYVKFNSAADQAEDVQQEGSLRQKGLAAFARETDKLIEQGAPAPRYHLGRAVRRGLPNRNFVLVAAS